MKKITEYTDLELREAVDVLLDNGHVIFHEQDLTQDELIEFCRRIGNTNDSNPSMGHMEFNPTDNPDNYYAGASAAADHALREQHIAENNSAVAQAISKSEFATELSQDVALQIRAGGIGGQKGAIKVKSKAMSEVIKTGIEDVEAIKNASDIKPGDIDAMDRVDLKTINLFKYKCIRRVFI